MLGVIELVENWLEKCLCNFFYGFHTTIDKFKHFLLIDRFFHGSIQTFFYLGLFDEISELVADVDGNLFIRRNDNTINDNDMK